jgi:hypothetical protein
MPHGDSKSMIIFVKDTKLHASHLFSYLFIDAHTTIFPIEEDTQQIQTKVQV